MQQIDVRLEQAIFLPQQFRVLKRRNESNAASFSAHYIRCDGDLSYVCYAFESYLYLPIKVKIGFEGIADITRPALSSVLTDF